MPAGVVLAQYGDLLFYSATAVYLLAMVLHAAEFAASRVVGRTPVSAPVGASDGGDEPAADRPARPWDERLGRMGVSLTVLGAGLHAASTAARGLATQRWPLGNMFEFTSAFCLAAVVTWLVLLKRSAGATGNLRRLGVFILLPVVVLLFLAGTVLYARAAPVVPALQSYWLSIHVTAASVSTGLLLVAGVASALFLLRRGPAPAEVLDRLAYRTTITAFPIWTFAVIAGAIWAEAAWGRFWGWDPKETVAFVAWVVYAAYLHARATAGWRKIPAAWINVAGMAVMLFNLFFINMVIAGLHSYAGLNTP